MKNLDEFITRYQGISELTISSTIILSEDMRVLSCNKAGKMLLAQLGKKFAKGLNLFDQIPEFGKLHPDFNLDSFEEKKILENWYKSKSYYLRFKFKKSEIDGLIVNVLFISDETKHAKIEEESRRLVKNHESLLGILGHDLISPLASMVGLLKLSIENNTIEYLPNILNLTERSIDQMKEVVSFRQTQVFDQRNLDKTKVYLHDIVEKSFDMLRLAADQKKIVLYNGVDKSLNVFVNKISLSSAISNFVTNAIKFSHSNSSIYVNSHNKDGFIDIIFVDNGVGMDEEEKNLLFSFEKFSKKGTNNEFGNGIGMITSYNLIKEMGGVVRVFSKKNEGTTIILSVPKQ